MLQLQRINQMIHLSISDRYSARRMGSEVAVKLWIIECCIGRRKGNLVGVSVERQKESLVRYHMAHWADPDQDPFQPPTFLL
jgi:hypothetical protein